MMTTLAHAADTSATLLAAGGGLLDGLGSFAPMILMVVVVYFLLLRPMSQEEKSRKSRLGDLKKGDKVVLTGGLLGRISRLEDHTAVVELTDKVKVRVLRKDIIDTEEHALAKAKDGDGGGGLFGNMLTPAGDAKSDDKDSSSDGTSGKSSGKSSGKNEK